MSKCNCFVLRYWGIDGGPVLSVWLAFDDSLEENGALRVIPGTSATQAFNHCPGWTLAQYKQISKAFPLESPWVFLHILTFRCPAGSHCAGMLPHHQAIRPGNMLTVNQEIPEELVKADESVLCPLLAGQMSVSLFSLLQNVTCFCLELVWVQEWVSELVFCICFHRFMTDFLSMPVTPTHPRRGAVALWSVMYPPVHIPQRWGEQEYWCIALFNASYNFTVLILILSVADRILIVLGSSKQQSWPVEQISSTISPIKPFENFPHTYQLLAHFTGIYLIFRPYIHSLFIHNISF